MNQNRNNNNNRRRGRGSNRGGQSGGGHQGNRIDSRARGNAPQMLEKYRKLAHDASLNGDRVLTEYYLQFADHYFRVVADSRPQRDEARPPREHNRDQPFGPEDYESEERDQGGREQTARDEQPRGQDRDRYEDDRGESDESRPGAEQSGQPADNPFTRDAREPQEPAQRSGQRARGRRPANDQANGAEPAAEAETAGGIDPGLLPPSIARDEDAAPRTGRARTRRPRRPDDDGEEALEATS